MRVSRCAKGPPASAAAGEAARHDIKVQKHAWNGWAVITFPESAAREAALQAGAFATIAGTKVRIKAHEDKATGREVPNALFVWWGTQAEERAPMTEQALREYFDKKVRQHSSQSKALAPPPGAAHEEPRSELRQVSEAMLTRFAH